MMFQTRRCELSAGTNLPAGVEGIPKTGRWLGGVLCLSLALLPGRAFGDARETFETHARSGDLAGGATALADLVTKSPHDQVARTLLGVTQVLQAVNIALQRQHDYGLAQTRFFLGAGLQLPAGQNPDPKPVEYKDLRQLLVDLQAGLRTAEATLAEVDVRQVKFLVDMSEIGFDFNRDGVTEQERLAPLLFGGQLPQEVRNRWVIGVDGGDVVWLRGYCHGLMAVCDMLLAYDHEAYFHCVGHRWFPKAVTRYEFLKFEPRQPGGWDTDFIIDVIASIHLLNFELAEPERMQAAHAHLLEVIALSRLSWKLILAESDDDHEWVPSPNQKGQLGVGVTHEMVAGWIKVLDETEAILQGQKLIPFWRPFQPNPPKGGRGLGLNLQKVFHEPRQFDLVVWSHGAGVAPYLEQGELTNIDFWNEMNTTFGRNLVGFSFWFN